MKINTLIMSALLTTGVSAATVNELERKINVLANEVQSMKSVKTDGRLSFGGYGEIVFTDSASEDEEGNAVSKDPSAQWDTLRNVLYVGYKFSDKWSMQTEIEIEHANEIYTEFAEVRYRNSDALNFKAGLLLAPVGFINEMHEPPTFYGVNRPELEKYVIPTTWRENGAGLYGTKGALSYKVFLLNSLDASDFDKSSGVRGGRQKGAKAKAGNWSYLARLDYQFNFGLDLGVTYYTGKTNGSENSFGVSAAGHKHDLWEVHAEYKFKGFRTRFLFAENNLEGKEISEITGNTVADKQHGYYAEVGYNIFEGKKDCYLAPYVRYEHYNLTDEVSGDVQKDESLERTNWTYGLMYKPVNNVSFKLDYMKKTNKAKTGVDTVNFGIGWQF